MENIFLNHLCYADDLCLSLSSAGMQKLLGICSKYAIDHSLTYNAKNNLFHYVSYLAHYFGRPELYLDNLLIPNVPERKYLGTIIRLGKHTKYRTYAFSYLCDLIPSQTGIATL